MNIKTKKKIKEEPKPSNFELEILKSTDFERVTYLIKPKSAATSTFVMETPSYKEESARRALDKALASVENSKDKSISISRKADDMLSLFINGIEVASVEPCQKSKIEYWAGNFAKVLKAEIIS